MPETPAARTGVAAFGSPAVTPRSTWGGDLRPTGALAAETVKFLIVHHTSQPGSDYTAGQVPGLLRGIFAYHTSSDKGWPDVAYNFFVDRFGGIWEGRTGSLAGPVQGSATGGNQGWTQLCCFVGDHSALPPSPQALASMTSLLAWLADRYGIDTSPGATVRVTSRGSNKHPAGAPIVARTIAAHREMSSTSCPGDACYVIVRDQLPQQVSALRDARSQPPAASQPPATTTPPPSTAPPTDTTATPPTTETTTVPTTTTAPTGAATSSTGPEVDLATGASATSATGGGEPPWWAAGLGAVLVGTGAAVLVLRLRARRVSQS